MPSARDDLNNSIDYVASCLLNFHSTIVLLNKRILIEIAEPGNAFD